MKQINYINKMKPNLHHRVRLDPETQKRLNEELKKEYSPEGIHYDFAGMIGIPYEQENIFFTALSKLPRKVIDLAKKIFFTAYKRTNSGEAYLLKSGNLKGYKAIVILYPALWYKPLEKIMDVLAHEIAHVYLKHEIGSTHNGDNEIAADDLASKWTGHKIEYYRRFFKKLNKETKKNKV